MLYFQKTLPFIRRLLLCISTGQDSGNTIVLSQYLLRIYLKLSVFKNKVQHCKFTVKVTQYIFFFIFPPSRLLHKLSNQDMIHYSISAIFRFLLKPTQIYYCRVFCWQFIKKLFILLYPHFLFGVRKWHQFFRQILLIIFK